GAPTPAAGQKTPNLVKPGARSPNPVSTPVGSPKAAKEGKRPVPPNLLGAKSSGNASTPVKPSGTPGVPPQPGAAGSPVLKQPPSGNLPARPVPKGTPPNLMAPRPSTAPAPAESQRKQAAGGP